MGGFVDYLRIVSGGGIVTSVRGSDPNKNEITILKMTSISLFSIKHITHITD